MPLLQPLAGFTRFAQPVWLLAAAAVVLLLPALYVLHDRRQRRALAAFAVEREGDAWGLGVSRGLLWLRRGCLTAAAVCGFLVLAQPLGAPQLRTQQDRGIDILFLMDTSRSMLTPDVRPDRLTRARLAVEDLLDQLRGDAVGLVAFAGQAFLVAPLTTDYDAFRETLEALDTRIIPVGGTDIAAAIRMAQGTLAAHHEADPVVVLITDGEDLGGEALAAAQAAGKAGIRIYTVGVGTAAGDLIPVPDDAGGERFVRDPEGNLVKSHLDEAMLRQIALATGGTYQPLGAQGQGVTELYRHTLSTLARHATAGRQLEVYAQLFQWPLALAVLLLFVEWLVRPVRRHQSALGPAAVVLAALSLWSAQVPRAHASVAEQQYGQGAQDYRAKNYDAAVKAWREALATTDVQLQQNAYYNLGNALYRKGSVAGADPGQAVQDFKQALSAYDAALQLRSTDADARFNRGVVQKKLDELQRQQQQRRQKQQGQDQGRSQDNPQQGQQDQSRNQQQGQSPDRQQGQQQSGQQGGQQQGSGSDPGQNKDQNKGQNRPDQNQGQSPDSRAQDSGPRNQPQGQGKNEPQRPQQGQGQGQGQGQPPPQPAHDTQPDAGAAQARPGQPQPGGMTREEAEHLLDSVRGQEHHLVTGGNSGKPDAPPVGPVRNW